MRLSGPLLALSILLSGCASETAEPDPASCKNNTLAVQILGSGGPIADDHRAGASNLVWIDGKARVLIDAGPGSFVRFGEAGAKFEDLAVILLTHFHGDHVGGLPGLLNAGSFSKRDKPVMIAGPEGSDAFPSASELLEAFVGKNGALRYLSPYLDGSADLPKITSLNIGVDGENRKAVMRNDGLEIDAIPVKHLEVPALAFVIKNRGKRIVFSGDQSFLSEGFEQATRNSKPDIMVMHNAISMADGQPRGLHRDGRSIGEATQMAGAQKLVLSHHMRRALDDKEAVVAAIRENYAGPIEFADDLSCFPVLE
ncbi:MBL fold metallo-hydrolase [Parasphingorhabdus halotolerans]|uniref:MBL fold metallo-hydrolase n=1 Tax=Parasphingorhabdus halotolerans TaxID=2725558 RepID=A0A6H2DJ13_9SPHN|nr:MBL fold metallo-hydrolase [Parasphingorhabdus halotolerans]QJB68662.1 MBL fold metallo-hydrolase [Parasphingorhabdus halotolerans]